MTNPQPRGTWTAHNKPDSWDMLHPGRPYRVMQSFRDYDGTEHPVGEQWTYVGYNFLPYDDGLSLFVSLDGEQEWHIRMQVRPEQQGLIVQNLSHYIAAVDPVQGSTHPALPPPSNRSTHLLLAASLVALLLGFFILHLNDDGPSLAAPTESALLSGLAGVAFLAVGALLGLIGIIKLVKPASTHKKRGSAST
jgi:hypothetical protein